MIKCIAAFDYFDKTLIVVSATGGVVCIIYFASIVGVPVGVTSPSFTLVFSFTTGIMKKQLEITRNKKKKHTKFLCFLKAK